MDFSIEDWNEATRNIIANASDQGQLTSLLTQASDKVTQLFASYKDTDDKNKQLQDENEKLKAYNMELFMQISAQNREKVGGNEVEANKSKAETITVADLFNKKED